MNDKPKKTPVDSGEYLSKSMQDILINSNIPAEQKTKYWLDALTTYEGLLNECASRILSDNQKTKVAINKLGLDFDCFRSLMESETVPSEYVFRVVSKYIGISNLQKEELDGVIIAIFGDAGIKAGRIAYDIIPNLPADFFD